MPKKMLIYFDTNLATGILEEPCLCLGKKNYFDSCRLLLSAYRSTVQVLFTRLQRML